VRKAFLAIVAAVVSAGGLLLALCLGTPAGNRLVTMENYDKLKMGMSKQQVTAILREPASVRQNNQGAEWVFIGPKEDIVDYPGIKQQCSIKVQFYDSGLVSGMSFEPERFSQASLFDQLISWMMGRKRNR
jgi:hypothetical protein